MRDQHLQSGRDKVYPREPTAALATWAVSAFEDYSPSDAVVQGVLEVVRSARRRALLEALAEAAEHHDGIANSD
jgi:hypothetical protein